jgi:DNA-binding IscR family transcriptional regulator
LTMRQWKINYGHLWKETSQAIFDKLKGVCLSDLVSKAALYKKRS